VSLPFDLLGVGLNATDTLLLVKEFPEYAGKVAFERELLSPGGQVATAVVTCARLGLRASYIGTIGDDLRGDIQRESLQTTGVDISGLIVRNGCPNQTAYIVIDERTGERTVFWQRSKCLRLEPSDIRADAIRAARMLHLDGYDVEAATFAATIARESGVPVSIDVDTVYPGFDSVLRNVDYMIAGSSWPAKWTGKSDPFEALSAIHAEYEHRVTAMTLGSRGSLALYEGDWYYSAAFEVPCVDTTGAGDVFHGAFCCAMLEGMSMNAALDFSNAAAALNCTAVGARGHVPVLSEVEALLRDANAGKVHRRSSESITERLAAASASASFGVR
jgi:sugar/nucleoside kinase (ribokinase family)